MSAPIDDGGPVSPEITSRAAADSYGNRFTLIETVPGNLSVRDYFAAAILPEILRRAGGSPQANADHAYKVADAMIERRAKP